jgi:hypothetical protein
MRGSTREGVKRATNLAMDSASSSDAYARRRNTLRADGPIGCAQSAVNFRLTQDKSAQ